VPRDIYCSGIQLINPGQVTALLEQNLEDFYDVWNAMIALRQLKVSAVYPKTWFSIDTLEQLARLPASKQ